MRSRGSRDEVQELSRKTMNPIVIIKDLRDVEVLEASIVKK
jgi:hypothetical protein